MVTPFGSCERRGVDVDIVKAGRDLLLDERAERVELLVAIGRGVLLRVHLDMVALEEDRPLEAFAQRRGEHAGDVFVRALFGVANLGPRDLEDEGARAGRNRGAYCRPRRVVRHHPDVHRRHGEPAGLAPAHRDVQLVNRGRLHAAGRCQRANDPAGRALDVRRFAE